MDALPLSNSVAPTIFNADCTAIGTLGTSAFVGRTVSAMPGWRHRRELFRGHTLDRRTLRRSRYTGERRRLCPSGMRNGDCQSEDQRQITVSICSTRSTLVRCRVPPARARPPDTISGSITRTPFCPAPVPRQQITQAVARFFPAVPCQPRRTFASDLRPGGVIASRVQLSGEPFGGSATGSGGI